MTTYSFGSAVISSNRAPYECLTEVSDDVVSIGKQLVEYVMERDRRPKETGSITCLVKLLEKKTEDVNALLAQVSSYRERAELIVQLEKCVENRDEVLRSYQDNIKKAEASMAKAIFQANGKLKKVMEANKNPVYSEEIIKFAHQISKSYSVAAPLFWKQGDPFRPFPTEAEFSLSSTSPRGGAMRPSTQPGSGAETVGSATGYGRGQESSASYQSRRSSSQTSPRKTGPLSSAQMEQMSTDSSSSSSSDEN